MGESRGPVPWIPIGMIVLGIVILAVFGWGIYVVVAH